MESNLRSMFPTLELDQVCKSYHEHAELAINDQNVDDCNQSLKELDMNYHNFCGYANDIDPFGKISVNKCSREAGNESECNSSRSQESLQCKWLTLNNCSWNGTHCLDARNTIEHNTSDLESVNRTCLELSNRSNCENVTLEHGQCSVSSISSSYLHPEHLKFCSNLSNSHECNMATVSLNKQCKWYIKQLDRISSNKCCRVPSLWCDEINRYFNFVNEDMPCQGELTCRDISGPNANTDRSVYSAHDLKRIDDICCSGLKTTYDPIQATFSPTSMPTNNQNILDNLTELQGPTSNPSVEDIATSVPSPTKFIFDSVSQSPSYDLKTFHDDNNDDKNSTISVHLEVYSAQPSSLVATANIGLFTIIPVLALITLCVNKHRKNAKNISEIEEEVLDPSQYEHVLSDSFDIVEDVEDRFQVENIQTDYDYQFVLDDSYDATRHTQHPYEANTAIDDGFDEDVMFPSLSEIPYQDEAI